MGSILALSTDLTLANAFIWYFVYVYTTVIHEAGHAWAAYQLGDRTAYEGGQVSLDPTPHIVREPIGMVVAPLISWFYYGGSWMLGWGSAPYDPTWASRYPRRAAWMAMAGPAANLILLIVVMVLMKVGLAYGVLTIPSGFSMTNIVVGAGNSHLWNSCGTFLSIAFVIQIIVFSFNLLPLPPLDGSAIPLFFLSERQCEKYQEFIWNPNMRIFGMLVAWQVYANVFPYVFRPALRFIYG